MLRTLSTIVAVAGLLAPGAALADKDAADLAALQVVMQRHIDSQLIDGALHHLDLETGQVVRYYPTEAHAMVMAIGDDYILCTDLASTDGASVPVDFYVTPTDDGYRVYQTEIDNREPLRALIGKNQVERIR